MKPEPLFHPFTHSCHLPAHPRQAPDVDQRPRGGGPGGDESPPHPPGVTPSRLAPPPSPGDGGGRGGGAALPTAGRHHAGAPRLTTRATPAGPGPASAATARPRRPRPRPLLAGRGQVCPAARCPPAGASRWRRTDGRQTRWRRPRCRRTAGHRGADVRPHHDPSRGPVRASRR